MVLILNERYSEHGVHSVFSRIEQCHYTNFLFQQINNYRKF